MKIYDIIDALEPTIRIFIKELSKKYNLTDNLLFEEDGGDGDGGDGDSGDGDDSSIDTNCSSYNSVSDTYEYKYDKFHTDKVLKYMTDKDSGDDGDIGDIGGIGDDGDVDKYFINPKILLTDFGLMQLHTVNTKTVGSRYYRDPVIICGLPYNFTIDIFALGCTLYEIMTSEILFDVESNSLLRSHDKNSVHLSMIMSLLQDNDQFEHLYAMYNTCPRRDMLCLFDTNTCLNTNKANVPHWIVEMLLPITISI